MFSSIKVKAPATTANLGSSFDCLGIAVELYNSIEISVLESFEKDVFVYNKKNDFFSIENNLIYKVIDKFFELESKQRPVLRIEIENDIPLSRGLGSSSAAIVSTLVAVNSLFFDDKYSFDELLNIAFVFEKHSDNLVASFFGGLVVSGYIEDKVSYYKFEEFKDNFNDKKILFIVPDYEIKTSNSRQALFNVNLGLEHKDYIQGLNKSILNTISFVKGNFNNLSFSMNDKVWHQIQRKKNIKFFDEICAESLKGGAYGVAISGSGPAIAIITDDKNVHNIKDLILKIKDINELKLKFLDLKPNYEGVKILWKK